MVLKDSQERYVDLFDIATYQFRIYSLIMVRYEKLIRLSILKTGIEEIRTSFRYWCRREIQKSWIKNLLDKFNKDGQL